MFAKGVRQSFIEAVLAGDAAPADIDDFIDAWHASDEVIGLAEFLGMTDEEYALWVEQPDVLSSVLHSRKGRSPVEELVHMRDPHRRGG